MVFSLNILILYLLCMAVSSIGFKNYVWFISLGYSFSIAAEGASMFVMYEQSMMPGTVLMSCLFIIYGFRLGGYLTYCEFGFRSYNQRMKVETKDGKNIRMGVKIAIWATCTLLYVFQGAGRVLSPAQRRGLQRVDLCGRVRRRLQHRHGIRR